MRLCDCPEMLQDMLLVRSFQSIHGRRCATPTATFRTLLGLIPRPEMVMQPPAVVLVEELPCQLWLRLPCRSYLFVNAATVKRRQSFNEPCQKIN